MQCCNIQPQVKPDRSSLSVHNIFRDGSTTCCWEAAGLKPGPLTLNVRHWLVGVDFVRLGHGPSCMSVHLCVAYLWPSCFAFARSEHIFRKCGCGAQVYNRVPLEVELVFASP